MDRDSKPSAAAGSQEPGDTDGAARTPRATAVGKAVAQRSGVADARGPSIDQVASAAVEGKDAGSPVPTSTRRRAEAQLGADLSGARVHQDDLASGASEAMGARAFAHGSDIFLGPGQRADDVELMTHELTHVVQQGAAGREAPQRDLSVGQANSPAEVEADRMASAAVAGARPAALIVEDEAQVEPAQMLKGSFMRELRERVTAAADEELGPVWSALGCPYIDQVFSRYGAASAPHIEQVIKRYAPAAADATSAAGYMGPVLARVREGVRQWKATGQMPADAHALVPESEPAGAAEVDAGTARPARDPAVREQPDTGAAPLAAESLQPETTEAVSPAGVVSRLGDGAPLESGTAARMSDAFGEGFGEVRIHTGSEAAAMAREEDARAMTVGSEVVFGTGEYKPGTAHGDALLAHELAHVVQQRGAGPQAKADPAAGQSEAHEQDADRAATGVLGRLYGGVAAGLKNVGPALRSGVQLQRCRSGSTQAPRAPLPPRPADQHEGLTNPDASTQAAINAALNPTTVAPAPTPPVGGGPAPAPAPPQLWDGSLEGLVAGRDDAEIARRNAHRAALRTEVTTALVAHLTRVTPDMAADASVRRLPASRFEGAANAAKQVADQRFGDAMAAASSTPNVASARGGLVYRGSGADQNLFDANDRGDRTTAGAPIDAFDVADWMANTDADAQTSFSTHHFNPSRAGSSEESDYLADEIIAPFVAGNQADLEQYDLFGFAIATERGIILPTTVNNGFDDTAGTGGEPSLAERATLWGGWKLGVHEYIHTLEHSAFGAAASGNRNMKEGFCELFTKEVLTAEMPGAHSNTALLTQVEGAVHTPPTTAAMIGTYSAGDYASYLAAAEAARDAIGGAEGARAVRAAFFQGHVELIGLNTDGTLATPRAGAANEVGVPAGVTDLDQLATAAGVTRADIVTANVGVDLTGALPARVAIPGCREHTVVVATASGEADTAETKAQIASQNGLREAELEAANPGVTWGGLSAGQVLLIPNH